MPEEEYQVPTDRRYTRTHEWVLVQESGLATFGITDYAQKMLGEAIYTELPKSGTRVVKGQPFLTLESAKASVELFSPLSGEIVRTNTGLITEPARVNRSPYVDGWLVQIKVLNPDEMGDLISPEEYRGSLG